MLRRKVFKKCEDSWLQSHIKFLRKGDVFRVQFPKETDIHELIAANDPYWDPTSLKWEIDVMKRV